MNAPSSGSSVSADLSEDQISPHELQLMQAQVMHYKQRHTFAWWTFILTAAFAFATGIGLGLHIYEFDKAALTHIDKTKDLVEVSFVEQHQQQASPDDKAKKDNAGSPTALSATGEQGSKDEKAWTPKSAAAVVTQGWPFAVLLALAAIFLTLTLALRRLASLEPEIEEAEKSFSTPMMELAEAGAKLVKSIAELLPKKEGG